MQQDDDNTVMALRAARAMHDEYYEVDQSQIEGPMAAADVHEIVALSRGSGSESLTTSVAFFEIPRVKLYLHTLAFAFYLLLYGLVVGVAWTERDWLSWSTAPTASSHMHPQWEMSQISTPEIAELLLWLYHLGRYAPPRGASINPAPAHHSPCQ